MKRRNVIACGLGVLCSLGATLHADDLPTYEGPKEKLHVYLLIGQSNMAGRAPFTEREAGVVEGAFLLNDKDAWEAAKNPLNRYSTIRKGLGMQKMNPGYTFARAMLIEHEAVGRTVCGGDEEGATNLGRRTK